MEKTRPRAMDVTAMPRQAMNTAPRPRRKLTRGQIIGLCIAAIVIIGGFVGWTIYQHRGDQPLLRDRYQAVYLVTGQVYIGKLQNTSGSYLTLTHVYTLQAPQGDTSKTPDNNTNLVQVSRQVYGPDDSMAIRADQVQFWQNLRTDSKVSQAIQSAGQSQ